jgi:translation elongation factor EF-1beta
MKALEESVRSIEMPGLVWGASKLVPIGYGIRKLQVTLVVGSSLVFSVLQKLISKKTRRGRTRVT